MWIRLLTSLLLLSTVAPAEEGLAAQHGITWFVQLSDLHISSHVHPEIVPDLHAFGDKVLQSLKPAAVVITGDLVDAKARADGSKQHNEEWQAYEQTWQYLAASAQLPPSAVLDLRGNHDVFDTLHSTDQDLFALHSAAAAAHGRAAAASRRVWLNILRPQVLLPHHRQHKRRHSSMQQSQQGDSQHYGRALTGHRQQHQVLPSNWPKQRNVSTLLQPVQHQQHHNGSNIMAPTPSNCSSTAAWAPVQHRRLLSNVAAKRCIQRQQRQQLRLLQQEHHQDRLQQQVQQTASVFDVHPLNRAPKKFTGQSACPAVVLLGLDFSPNIGLHSPANFFGVASTSLLDQVQQQLKQLRGGSSNAEDVGSDHDAAAHWPCGQHVPIISYSHYPFSTVTGAYDSKHLREQEGGRAVRDVLMRYGVSAHLSGHLHDLTGPKMHTLHAKQGRNGRHPDGNAAFLADLETSDWKHKRRWRLVVVDSGVVSFADLHFERQLCSSSTSSGGNAGCYAAAEGGPAYSGYSVQSVDNSRYTAQHLVLLTWPPDRRYSQLMGQLDITEFMLVKAAASVDAEASSDLADKKGSQDYQRQQQQELQSEVVLPVRALVAPLQTQAPAGSSNTTSSSSVQQVQLTWSCQMGDNRRFRVEGSSKRQHQQSQCGSRAMYPIGHHTGAATAAAGSGPGDDDSTTSSSSESKQQGGLLYALQQPQVFGTMLSQQEVSSCCTVAAAGSAGPRGSVRGAAVMLLLQATATAAAGSVSVSELRPVLLQQVWPSSSQPQKQQQHHGSSNGADHLPLPSSFLEQLVIKFDGPAFARQLFFTGWLIQSVLLLLVPRLFQRQLFKWRQQLTSGMCSNTSSNNAKSLTSTAADSWHWPLVSPVPLVSSLAQLVLRAAWGLGRTLLQLLLLPFASMAVLAHHHIDIWWAMAGHCAYSLLCPWFAAQLCSSSGGLGLWFRYGLLLQLPAVLSNRWIINSDFSDSIPQELTDNPELIQSDSEQHWVWMGLPDAHLVSSLTAVLLLAPVTLWIGMLVSYWHDATAAAAAKQQQQATQSAMSAQGAEVSAVEAPIDGKQAGKHLDGPGRNACYEQQQLLSEIGVAASPRAAAGISPSQSAEQTNHHQQQQGVQQHDVVLAISSSASITGSSAVNQRLLSRSASTPAKHRRDPRASASGVDAESAGSAAPHATAAMRVSGTDAIKLFLSHVVYFLVYVVLLFLRATGWIFRLALLTMRFPLVVVRGICTAVWIATGSMALDVPLHLLILVLPVLFAWYKAAKRLLATYGIVALVLSPVIGWLPLLVLLALQRAKQQLSVGKECRPE